MTLAQIKNPVLKESLQGQSGVGFFQTLLPNLITIVLIIGILVFIFTLLMGGIQWIQSGGDKQALSEAKEKVAHALIGIIILLAVFALVRVVEDLFGVNIISVDIGPLVIQ